MEMKFSIIMDRELGVVIAKSRWSPQVFIWENCIVDFYPKFDSRFIERTCSIQSTVLSITRFIWGAPCTVQQMQKRYYFGFFAKNWNEIVAARFPFSLSLSLSHSHSFSWFFSFFRFFPVSLFTFCRYRRHHRSICGACSEIHCSFALQKQNGFRP